MATLLQIVSVLVLVVHGLIHAMGYVAYYPLRPVAELPYKTAFLGGRMAFGGTGTRAFSVLWLAAAFGFIVAAVALVAGWSWAMPLVVGTTLLSLTVTALDWPVAWRGALIDVGILLLVLLGPSLHSLVQ